MYKDLGQDFYTLKKNLMEYHNQTSTNLDKGIGMDPTVYFARRRVKVSGEWHWDDYGKFGKAKSIYNRARIYNQPGDTQVIWTIDCSTMEAAANLEKLIHDRWQEYKPKENLMATEIYDIDQETAYKEFFNIIEELGLADDKNIIRGVLYAEKKMEVYDFTNKNKKVTSVISFNTAQEALDRLYLIGVLE